MKEVAVVDGSAFCRQCGRVVAVKDKGGEQGSAQLRHVLVDTEGHVVAERTDGSQPWAEAA
jgi:hypothetical protein